MDGSFSFFVCLDRIDMVQVMSESDFLKEKSP
jgi:hypothetical protein